MTKPKVVTITMSRNNVFPWQSAPSFEATLLRGPDGPGDTFKLDVAGRFVEINGNSAEFVGVTHEPRSAHRPG